MKATYGTNNCFLLRMNSRPPGKTEQLPDPWSRYIVNRRVHIVSQEAISPPGGDGSPNIIKTLVESPEFKKDGNNLEYHPLSPDRVPVNYLCFKIFMYKILIILGGRNTCEGFVVREAKICCTWRLSDNRRCGTN